MKNLMQDARDGDVAAQDRLRESLRPRMESLAGYYASRTGMDAADLLQEAWLAVFEVLPTVDVTIGTPSQFLLKHARWQILDHIRWNKRRSHEMLDDTLAESASFAASGGVSTANGSGGAAFGAGGAWGGPAARPGTGDVETRLMVEALQQKLSGRQKVILHGLMEGQTWRQIGESLGCTSANIAYHVRGIRQAYGEMVGLSDIGSDGETIPVGTRTSARTNSGLPVAHAAVHATARNATRVNTARTKPLA